MDNQSLIDGIRAHDKKTIRYIYTKFLPMIEDLVRKNGKGSPDDAADLFMNAMEVFCIKTADEHFKLTSSFSTLLYEICKRQWLKELKRKKTLRRVTIHDHPALIADDFGAALDQAEQYQLYREKFAKLTIGCRQILKLVFDGFSMKEIAQQLGFASEQYARKRKFKCKEKLSELIRRDSRFQELRNYERRRKK